MRFNYRGREFDLAGFSERDVIYSAMLRSRSFYELDLLEYMYAIRRHLGAERAVSIDVGANVGNHSVFFRSFLCDRLIAVEPNPVVLPTLRRNLAHNVTDFVVCDCALGSADGLGTIFLPESAQDNVGMARVEQTPTGAEIRITTLDSLVADIMPDLQPAGRINLVKVDVEGSEIAVLEGAQSILDRHRPHLFLEAATSDEAEQLRAFLTPLGYAQVSRWASTPVYHYAYKPKRSLVRAAEREKLRQRIRRHLDERKRERGMTTGMGG